MTERRQKGDDLTGRRQGYAELRKELHHFFRKIWIVVILIGVTSVGGLAGFGYLLHKTRETSLQRCENINARHDNAIYALIAGSNKDQQNAKTEAGKAEIRRRRDVTIGLIDALAPKSDCSDPVPVKPVPAVTPIPEGP